MKIPEYSKGQEPVLKATIRVTVLAQETDPVAFGDALSSMSLEDIGREIDVGLWIGESQVIALQALPEDRVVPELVAMHNDGEFFNCDEDARFEAPDRKPEPEGQILRAQVAQGWSSETMAMLQSRFLDEVGLKQEFADWLDDRAAEENDAAPGPGA
ncbi:hypothetical protein [Defluviimonas salinarum]|uniref:Uncharacterized protein n=1 Tax=Defluviimonas salinarum TaxID=2992147 RepID=A0ABT3J5M0_9RHOB|nr:hypothetical protein [Defluviimonas salinarum]MCW3782992.1 hypothetical protein [Defluviimonas salinarum]